MRKPFMYGKPVEGEHFIGRKKEIEQLKNLLQYGTNVVLISPRRWGKTSLVNRVSTEIQSNEIKVIQLDAFLCRSEFDFYNAFAAAVLKQTSSKLEEWKQNAQDFLGRIMPKFSFSPDNMQEYSVSMGMTSKTHSPEEILNLPEKIAQRKGWHIIICIDEFQQIGDFPETLAVQKTIRTVWQKQKNVSYLLYGSKKHMMSTLFQQKEKPFYKFGSTLFLTPIPTEEWIPYLCGRFESEGKKLTEELAANICQRVENHSSYVQQLAMATLINTDGPEVTEKELEAGFNDLLNECDIIFTEKTENLTTYQMNFLRALHDGVTSNFGEANIREKYALGSYSNISRIKTALIEKELIDTKEEGIFFADPLLKYWLRNRLMR